MMPDTEFEPEWHDQADHVGMCQAARHLRHAKVAVGRVVAQAPSLEGSLVELADDEAPGKCHESLREVDRLPTEREAMPVQFYARANTNASRLRVGQSETTAAEQPQLGFTSES